MLGLGVRQEPWIGRERKEQNWYRADAPMDRVVRADSGFSDYQGVKREHDHELLKPGMYQRCLKTATGAPFPLSWLSQLTVLYYSVCRLVYDGACATQGSSRKADGG